MGLANISFEHRPILQKHKVYSLYHPSAEALASTISSFPFRMIGLTFFIIILYFLAGLHRSAGAFFYYVFVFDNVFRSYYKFVSDGFIFMRYIVPGQLHCRCCDVIYCHVFDVHDTITFNASMV